MAGTDEHDYPVAIRIIDDLTTLHVVADPLRLQILALLRRAPHTVKELAKALSLAQTKLYYHIKLLEERDLIRVVGQRASGGPTEKEYGVTAYRLSVDRALLAPGADAPEDALDTFLSFVLDQSREEIKRGVRAGLIDPDPAQTGPGGLTLGRLWLRLTPDEAADYYRRLVELEREFAALHPKGDDDPALVRYEMLVGLYATIPQADEQAP